VPVLLTSELYGDAYSASRTGRFNPKEDVPVSHEVRVEGWVDLKAGLDDLD